MWIKFKCQKSYLINIYCGGVNAVSRAPPTETFIQKLQQIQNYKESPKKSERLRKLQDYIVVPEQLWLDGFATADGIVKQFAAMPFESGYSVEAQISGQEVSGGLHFEVTPLNDIFRIHIRTLIGRALTLCVRENIAINGVKCPIQAP